MTLFKNLMTNWTNSDHRDVRVTRKRKQSYPPNSIKFGYGARRRIPDTFQTSETCGTRATPSLAWPHRPRKQIGETPQNRRHRIRGRNCVYVCTHVCMHVCMYACTHERRYVCMYVCMYVCVYVCMYACMHVCMCVRCVRWAASTLTYFARTAAPRRPRPHLRSRNGVGALFPHTSCTPPQVSIESVASHLSCFFLSACLL